MARKSARWTTPLSGFKTHLHNIESELVEEVQAIIEDEIEVGKNEMVNAIETRGTGYVGRGRASLAAKQEGRVDDGIMRDSVEAAMVSARAGRFGWGIHNEQIPDYFLEQEWLPTIGGHPPMHALMDAWVGTKTRYIARVRHLMTGR